MEALRRESRAKAWMPEEDEVYFYVYKEGDERSTYWSSDSRDRSYYKDGNCHPDKQSAQKWKDEGYWEAFNCLF